jgi:myo-inositol-1-phosphate synthase
MAKTNVSKLFKNFGAVTRKLLTVVQSVRHYPGMIGLEDYQATDNFSSVAEKVSRQLSQYIMLDLNDRNPDMLMMLSTFLENKIAEKRD